MKATFGGGLARTVVGAAVWTSAGCMSAEGDPQLDDARAVDLAVAPIIGGMVADSPTLDAVGSVSLVNRGNFPGAVPSGALFSTCTGTLIDSDTVVTAKHCIDDFAAMDAGALVFAIGPDVANPRLTAEVLTVQRAPGDEGGFTGYGHDVAVLQLATPITDVTPFSVASLGEGRIGEAFVSIGYGFQDNTRTTGQRLAGEGTLRARSGRTLEALFGDFDTYYESMYGAVVPTDCPDSSSPPFPTAPSPGPIIFPGPSDACFQLRVAQQQFEQYTLEEADEVVVGVADGGAQPCHGDSGGPLLQRDSNGHLISYGVVSGGHGSDEQICDWGTVYATFPSEVLDFVTDAMSWVDPCRELPAAGACEGSLARRCSTLAECERRVLTFDCARLGLACVADAETAAVGCGDETAVTEPIPAEPTPAPEPAPTEPAPTEPAPTEPAPAPTP